MSNYKYDHIIYTGEAAAEGERRVLQGRPPVLLLKRRPHPRRHRGRLCRRRQVQLNVGVQVPACLLHRTRTLITLVHLVLIT